MELKKYKTWVSEKLLKAGIKLDEDKFILFADDLGPLHKSVPQDKWDKLLKLAELKHRGIHHLRHTFASNLISQGLQMKLISDMMGHSTITTTMDVYGHLLEVNETETRSALERIERMINI